MSNLIKIDGKTFKIKKDGTISERLGAPKGENGKVIEGKFSYVANKLNSIAEKFKGQNHPDYLYMLEILKCFPVGELEKKETIRKQWEFVTKELGNHSLHPTNFVNTIDNSPVGLDTLIKQSLANLKENKLAIIKAGVWSYDHSNFYHRAMVAYEVVSMFNEFIPTVKTDVKVQKICSRKMLNVKIKYLKDEKASNFIVKKLLTTGFMLGRGDFETFKVRVQELKTVERLFLSDKDKKED